MAATEFSLAITGAGGAGVISVGELLLQAWAAAGGRGLLRKAFGPQIRGGESAALLKLTDHERYTAADRCDLLLALDWNNFTRFGDEIRLHADSIVLCQRREDLPDTVAAFAPRVIELPFTKLSRQAHESGRENMLALGVLGRVLNLSADALTSLAQNKLAGKPAPYREAAARAIEAGFAAAPDIALTLPGTGRGSGWYLSGNQAAGYGALAAGIRFVAAYPITPASDALEYIAAPLERLGGNLVQAEDELAAINMALGAAYGGVPAFTATSGPGLALMTESLGLAVASETPVTLLNVMRGGPSTGIPTKSEQSDLNIALHGLHGDAPHIVMAPLSIGDCVPTTARAVHLAEAMQCPAIVLSDQFLGHSTAVISPPDAVAPVPPLSAPTGDFARYALTDSGLSPRAAPGMPGLRFTADGLEHNVRGTPSAGAADHQQQLDKRQHKLESLRAGEHWGEVEGEGSLALLCFGSASAAVFDAAETLRDAGIGCRAIALRLLSPLPVASIAEALEDCEQLFVIEQNHGGQLLRHLRGEMALAGAVQGIARPGPIPLSAREIVSAVRAALSEEASHE
jgi:2-oxoglutarate ferredoxin oxidoreductase subunit alpha